MSDEHKYPSQMAERFQVRMPDGLRDRLRDAAAANSRSMNSEIVARLEASFEEALDAKADAGKWQAVAMSLSYEVDRLILELRSQGIVSPPPDREDAN